MKEGPRVETVVESQADPVVDEVRRALAWQRERRRWRHLVLVCAGAATAYLGATATVLILIGRGASLGGHARLPLYAGLCAGGVVVASLGWHRLRPVRAVARLPIVAGALIAWLPVLLLLTTVRRDHRRTGDGSALAMALVDRDFATLVLGGPFSGPQPVDGFLVRSESMARLQSEKRVLTVLVGCDPGGARRQAAPGGVQVRSRTAWAWGGAGDWTIQMSLVGAGKDAGPLLTVALAAAERRLRAGL